MTVEQLREALSGCAPFDEVVALHAGFVAPIESVQLGARGPRVRVVIDDPQYLEDAEGLGVECAS